MQLHDVELQSIGQFCNVVRGLIRENADALQVARDCREDVGCSFRSQISRTAGEDDAHVRCTERRCTLRVFWARQATELDLSSHDALARRH